MQLTAEQLTTLNNCGQLLLPPADVAFYMQLDADQVELLLTDRGHAGYEAYHAGRIETELALRASILKFAKAGSSPAQTMAKQLLDTLKSQLHG
ncbi:terminase small subunit [Microcystis phage Mae-Yong924-2]|nr:terminase small subunit [Microcystis phage Mea-Yong924-1]QYC50725.1 terminase small subunit [Microcystis phage Mae-Yong924-2]